MSVHSCLCLPLYASGSLTACSVIENTEAPSKWWRSSTANKHNTFSIVAELSDAVIDELRMMVLDALKKLHAERAPKPLSWHYPMQVGCASPVLEKRRAYLHRLQG